MGADHQDEEGAINSRLESLVQAAARTADPSTTAGG